MKINLVLSGGGAKGAYQVGALQALDEVLTERAYHKAIGVSVGAINAAGLSALGIEGLSNLWHEIRSADDIQSRQLWKLFWMKGIYNFGPLRELLDRHLPKDLRRWARGFDAYALALDLQDKKELLTSQKMVSRAAYIDAIIGSSSLAFFHEPVRDRIVDAGHSTPVPVHYGLKLDSPDKVVVIGTQPICPAFSGKFDVGFFPPAHFGIRAVEVMFDRLFQYSSEEHLKDPRVIMFTPSGNLEIGGMEYDPEKIKKTIAQGYEETKRACQTPHIRRALRPES